MQLSINEIHVYVVPLDITTEETSRQIKLLNEAEKHRAGRLISPLHQRRFIAAHAALRQILSNYLNLAPHIISFRFNEYDKPALANTSAQHLHFNLSHSENLAVIAVTQPGEIGIDIEKITTDAKLDVAERFFSGAEIAALNALPSEKQAAGFYRLWARKEAIIKANGKGLHQPLSSFSVSIMDIIELLTVDDRTWTILPLTIDPEFAGAIAVSQPISTVSIWDYIDQKALFRSSIKLLS